MTKLAASKERVEEEFFSDIHESMNDLGLVQMTKHARRVLMY